MNLIYLIGGIVTLALFIYLVVALLKPEVFS
jgi:K+-transporting ATPase KdpF subunit